MSAPCNFLEIGSVTGLNMSIKEYNDCVKSYSDRLFRYCLKMCRSHEQAEDAVQLAYIKLWQQHKRLDVKVSKSWLFTTVYRNVMDEKRKEKRAQEYTINRIEYAKSSERFELREILNRALETLPLEQKSALLLRDYEGYSYKEIEEITGFSEAKVKTLIFRARKKLQKHPDLLKEMNL